MKAVGVINLIKLPVYPVYSIKKSTVSIFFKREICTAVLKAFIGGIRKYEISK